MKKKPSSNGELNSLEQLERPEPLPIQQHKLIIICIVHKLIFVRHFRNPGPLCIVQKYGNRIE